MKQCIKCKDDLELEMFYKAKTKNGYTSECKKCTKLRISKTRKENSSNPEWIKKERKRGRDKYHRLNYKQYANRSRSDYNAHRKRFPEKYKANSAAQHISIEQGYERHHWSYKTEHHKNIIPLSVDDHNNLHVYIIYDMEHLLYRTQSGVLLDTKEKHIEYLKYIQTL